MCAIFFLVTSCNVDKISEVAAKVRAALYQILRKRSCANRKPHTGFLVFSWLLLGSRNQHVLP